MDLKKAPLSSCVGPRYPDTDNYKWPYLNLVNNSYETSNYATIANQHTLENYSQDYGFQINLIPSKEFIDNKNVRNPQLKISDAVNDIDQTLYHAPSAKKFNKMAHNANKSKSKNLQISCKNIKAKRHRTIFTVDQLERLEAEFDQQQYMVGSDRVYLAKCLKLTELQIKIWFQNRRIKWRRQHPWEPMKKGDETP